MHFICAQLYPTLCDPLNCSPPGSSIHVILQARILEWVAMPSSRGSSQPRYQSWVSCISLLSSQDTKAWGGRLPALYTSYYSHALSLFLKLNLFILYKMWYDGDKTYFLYKTLDNPFSIEGSWVKFPRY